MTPLLTIEHPVRIHFYDVDSMNVVWHGNYVKYFEQARSALLDCIGYNYEEMQESGYIFPVVELQIKYMKPIFLNQEIIVKASLMEYENRIKINFQIFDKEILTLLTKATSIQVAVKSNQQTLEFETPLVFRKKIQERIACKK